MTRAPAMDGRPGLFFRALKKSEVRANKVVLKEWPLPRISVNAECIKGMPGPNQPLIPSKPNHKGIAELQGSVFPLMVRSANELGPVYAWRIYWTPTIENYAHCDVVIENNGKPALRKEGGNKSKGSRIRAALRDTLGAQLKVVRNP